MKHFNTEDVSDKKVMYITFAVCLVVLLITGIVFWSFINSNEDEPVVNTGNIADVDDSELLDTENEVEEEEPYVKPVPVYKEIPFETDEPSFGIDVSSFQKEIDWEKISQSGVDFAIIRIGNRNSVSGEIEEDECARYNLQEATKHGIKVGAYFVSTAITEEEIMEEVEFLCDIIDGYSITYPVVYDCEGFSSQDHRQNSLSVKERTDLGMLFMEEVENRGYVSMFYASSYNIEFDLHWVTSEIELKYRVWVAQYRGSEKMELSQEPSYAHEFSMWQYTQSGSIDGIEGAVDLNTSYFTCGEVAEPIAPGTAQEVSLSLELGVNFQEVNEDITAKEKVNIRSTMDQGDNSNVIGSISNGTVIKRTGIGHNGWSRVEYNGEIAYLVSSFVTTDLNYTAQKPSGFNTVFSTVNEQVTAKDVINLRDTPSVEEPSKVVCELKNGEVATRTGIAGEGWSRVEYNGQVLYCVTNYLQLVE